MSNFLQLSSRIDDELDEDDEEELDLLSGDMDLSFCQFLILN